MKNIRLKAGIYSNPLWPNFAQRIQPQVKEQARSNGSHIVHTQLRDRVRARMRDWIAEDIK